MVERIEKLERLLAEGELDALWVSTPENVRYLSGFSAPEDGRVLVLPGAATLYTDARYEVQAGEESSLETFIWRKGEQWKDDLKARAQGLKLGFEAEQVTVAGLEELEKLGGLRWTPTKGLVEGLRAVKSDAEVRAIRRAAALADRALSEVVPLLVPGATEREIALELEFRMRRAGADGAAFEIIVASGPRSAMPHGTASGRALEAGDLVTIDLGARLGGYHSDLTRAYPVGEVSDGLRRLYRLVRQAKRLALEQVAPGVGCKALDAVARDFLKSEGFEDAFAHSLGHGVGLAVHEGPRLSYRLEHEVPLEAGNVITVEPGLYVPGVGGVRLEDLVLVTPGGCEILSKATEVEL